MKLTFRTAVIPAVSFQGIAPKVILTPPPTGILAWLVVSANHVIMSHIKLELKMLVVAPTSQGLAQMNISMT